MDNSQNNSNETKNLQAGQPEESQVDVSRRHFSRLGAVTPVLLTLASRPVFGANCLSNMMSGNLSDPDRGQCSLGWSPGGWKNPNGQINGMPTITAWQAAGYYYGELDGNNDRKCVKRNGKIKNKRECYSGGSVYGDTPLPGNDSRTLIEILGTNDIKKHYIAALLNASLSQSDSGFNYILTVDQVIGLCNRTIPVPGGLSLRGFLDSTWV